MIHTLRMTALVMLCTALWGCSASEDPANKEVMTQERQDGMTPDDVLADLKAGNERFVAGKSTRQDWLAQASSTARAGQFPKAIVLGCLDSRVPPETIFDQGIGDIFVGRIAGNFENVEMIGSMEFGTKLAGAHLIVVLGHTSCGAVKGAVAGAQLGNLTATLENIKVAMKRAGDDTDAPDYVERVMKENVRQTRDDILAKSEVVTALVKGGELKVVGAWYDIATGMVHWLED